MIAMLQQFADAANITTAIAWNSSHLNTSSLDFETMTGCTLSENAPTSGGAVLSQMRPGIMLEGKIGLIGRETALSSCSDHSHVHPLHSLV